jgi:hypothetical protein
MRLDFPLDQDDKIAIKETLFVKGTATLVSGSATIINPRISTSSVGLVSRKTAGGTTGDLRISCSGGQATITSSSATDTSDVYYLILV